MPATSGDRAAQFPAIERKHGHPMVFWFERLAELDDDRYPVQIAYLRTEHGFSQAHANAVVMYHRGSTSSKRFTGPDAYFASIEPRLRDTARAIIAAITAAHPELELVVAWNQPMLRRGDDYVFGLSASKDHLTISPWSTAVLDAFRERLSGPAGLTVNKKTFRVPADWTVDAPLLCALVEARLGELDRSDGRTRSDTAD